MVPFLYQVAKVYVDNEAQNLANYTFVFPNKRSGVFFSNYITQIVDETIILPKIETISDFISEFSTGIEASRMELIFILYQEYRKIILERTSNESHLVDFDKFQFWAEMILNDFNDVDKYLVDAKQLFQNVKKLKEISSNFLTDEQIKVINQYWGETRLPDSMTTFWKHINHQETEGHLTSQFIRLWEILYDLYVAYNTRLTNNGLCYSGMSYREVAESVNHGDVLFSSRYIFVGFNVLSASEIKIFEKLKSLGKADFYWDYNSPAFDYKDNRATRFVGKYIEKFKSKYRLDENKIKEFPEINIIGVPSNIGQVKESSAILSQIKAQSGEIAENTAIVLPDEGLFIPLLHSLPNDVSDVNITMGYPMRHTSVASLMNLIVSMQLRARIVHEKIQFYYEDILNILSHPLIRKIATKECRQIVRYINDNRVFNLTSEYICDNYPTFSAIFVAVKDLKNCEEVVGYIRNLLLWIRSNVSVKNKSAESYFIDKYIDALNNFEYLSQKYHIAMSESTVFHWVERVVGAESVNFEGKPLKGLQVMGVLETRALDFENLIILSMNERVFPRKHYSKTFIPNSLRKAYGMSTISYQESMYAYYFYRMISRAKNVYIMYDSRSGGLRSGEMSRYLHQLKFLYQRDKIKFSVVNYDVLAPEKDVVAVKKTHQIMAKLNGYKNPESNRYLSASALNKYISCPLSFYLYYVEEMQQEDEILEYMDEGTYGTIMHEIAEKFYNRLKGDAKEVLVTTEILDSQKKRQGEIMQQITRSINNHYNKLGENNDTPLHGDSEVLGKIMLHFTLLMFENEKQFADFYFIDAEKKQFGQWKINDKHTINFKQIIDRIDKVEVGSDIKLRFVDYKTGGDKVDLDALTSLFDRDKKNRRKAIFQLFVYCLYYAYSTGYDGDILPYIYSYRTINTEHLPPITVGTSKDKKVLNGYLEYKDEFYALFEQLIDEIFDENIPFVPSQNDEACKYCKFTVFCNKEIKQ